MTAAVPHSPSPGYRELTDSRRTVANLPSRQDTD